MNRMDVVGKIVKETGISKSVAEKALASVLGGITGALKKGDKVTFVGFGSFSVSERKARKGRNPQTGKEIKIAAKKVPRFTAGSGLKEAVGGKKKK